MAWGCPFKSRALNAQTGHQLAVTTVVAARTPEQNKSLGVPPVRQVSHHDVPISVG